MARVLTKDCATITLIQEVMTLLGIKNQTKLAEAIGVSRSSINLLMLGKRDMSVNTRRCLIGLLADRKKELIRKIEDTDKMIETLQKGHVEFSVNEILQPGQVRNSDNYGG